MSNILEYSTYKGEENEGEVQDWPDHDARWLPFHLLQTIKKDIDVKYFKIGLQ